MKSRVFFVQFTNPGAYPPIQHAARILNRHGCDIVLFALTTPETSQIKFESVPDAKFYWIKNSRNRFVLYGIYVWFCLKAIYLICAKKIDWVYGSDHWALPVLYFSKIFLHKKIIYHEHDSPGGKQSFLLKQLLKLRKAISMSADIKIVPNKCRIATELNPENWIQVKNCPLLEEVLEPLPKRKDALMIYYHGSINPVRLPLRLIDAFKLLGFSFSFKFAGYDNSQDKRYVQQFMQAVNDCGLSGCVTYLGVLPTRKELLKNCLNSHVGIVFMPKTSHDVNMVHMCGASNKPYDYLAAGCAVLVSDLPEWKISYVDSGVGLACNSDSVESIAAVLKKFYENMDQTIEMGRRGRERILKDWNYEKEFEPVLNKMGLKHE